MASILDPIPNSPFYSPPSYSVYTPSGNLILGSGLSVTPQGVIVSASTLGGTVSQVTAGVGLSAVGGAPGGTITTSGTIQLIPPTGGNIGGVKAGPNITIAADGTISTANPGSGTITGITVGSGLSGGGGAGNVTINLLPATTSTLGGVVVGTGISVVGGLISLAPSTTVSVGGVQLATNAEVIAGTSAAKAVTPAGLAAKVASTLVPGIVQLSDSVAANDSTKAATQTAARTAYLAATAAQTTANAALPLAGGVMTGIITFAAGQTFPGVSLPIATTSSLGVVIVSTGLSISPGGYLTTVNNGTITSIIAGPGLGAPATGNPVTTSGTIRLLPPTIDGLTLGGVKAGSNVNIAVDGTISVPSGTFISTNNQYAYNGYQWPISNASPALPFPGTNGQVLTVLNNVTGSVGWTNTGTLNSVVAGTGITVASTATTATVSLATVPSIVPGTFGATAIIPTFTVNQYGQLTSSGSANTYPPFLTATQTAPPNLVLDFDTNNTNWTWTLQGNTTIGNPLNAQSGMTGSILITQNPLTPYVLTWGSAWKFQSFTPFAGGNVAEVALIKFTVVAANYIVVDAVVTNLG
jgi:hypothetical protein